MSVKVSVKIDNTKINRLIEAHKKALEMTADAVLSDIKTSAVVPKDTSTLEDSAFVDRSELTNCIMRIVFDTPYARRLYWHPEYNFRKDKNPNAQGKWMDSYLYGDNKQFIIDTYSKFLKMLSEGLIK
ncbi:minor capsid protein [Clostridium cadaveris]|uniref:minor capsid protein n=1 Tax=Clostridium cadaveris TaxID=1529 RepID=UPI000428BBF7|nr:minor capsid protein [Clostridium cadaveris]MDM8313131.1 minor capsid protein [Clostridium cadaveris]